MLTQNDDLVIVGMRDRPAQLRWHAARWIPPPVFMGPWRYWSYDSTLARCWCGHVDTGSWT